MSEQAAFHDGGMQFLVSENHLAGIILAGNLSHQVRYYFQPLAG
jgi:hypothetical protein